MQLTGAHISSEGDDEMSVSTTLTIPIDATIQWIQVSSNVLRVGDMVYVDSEPMYVLDVGEGCVKVLRNYLLPTTKPAPHEKGVEVRCIIRARV